MRSAVLFCVFLEVAFSANPDWNGLKVTWSMNPFNSWGFDSQPRVMPNGTGDYQLRDDQCKNPNGKFYGQRYWFKQDPALTLLFDKKGVIAGIQTSVPKSVYAPSPYQSNRYFIDDGVYWSLTAYFVEPSSICTNGRTQEQLKNEGTGTGLWLQTGPNPLKDTVRIPTTEEDVKKTWWKAGQCFWTMGNHYWYNVTKNMDCGHFVPTCLMYNKGKLTGFCFSVNAGLNSTRYEHPTAEESKKFIDPVPDCFFSDPAFKKLSSIHVYLIDSPKTSSWC